MQFGLALAAVAVVVALLIVALGGDEDEEVPGGVREVAAESGIDDVTHTWGADVGDFTGNGWPDIVLPRHKRGIKLLLNRGGRFEEVTKDRLVGYEKQADRHHCVFGDVNVDDRPDFLCTMGGFQGKAPSFNELWMQQDDGSFVNRAREYGVEDKWGRGRKAAFVDANGDRWPDLYLTNEYPRQDGQRSLNRLLINERGERFRNAPEFGLEAELGSLDLTTADFNADGKDDIILCDQKGDLRFFENVDQAGFEENPDRLEGPKGCAMVRLGDVGGSPEPDLVWLRNEGVDISHWENGKFVHKERHDVEYGRDIALGDIDGDDTLDVYVLRTKPRENLADQLLYLRDDGDRVVRADAPNSTEGFGHRVEALDFDGNGRDDFFVMNGKHTVKGPLELIASFPEPRD